MRRLALAGAACWLVHAIDLIYQSAANDLLWVCNVAGPLLALGCALRARRLIAMPVLWLSFGTPLWLLDMFTGGEIMPTSFLTHVGCLAIGVAAIHRLGWPAGTGWRATLALVGLMLVTRLATPPELNINLAFAVWPGWEPYFRSYPVYFAALTVASVATFAVMERVYLRVAPGPPTAG